MIYDTFMRLPYLTWVLLSAVAQIAGLIHYVILKPVDLVYAIHVTMQLSTIVFLMLMAAAVLFRTRPSVKASGLEPRISALAGTFLMYAIALFPRHELSVPAEVVATVLTMIGTAGAIVALSQLGRSFSIMTETRKLVTTGPYRYVRHPLYVAEEVAMLGLFMQFASVWTALLFAVQIAFQVRRMHNEESVLLDTFPAYDAYRRNTARLIPGIY